jgi:TetR/AcrR family fatty acid metabolism transcriptional regulator
MSKEEAVSTAPENDVGRGPGKRERILRAAIDVFATHGYFNARVAQIAKAAGVADGTIYLYFSGKEELLVTIFREHTRTFLESLRAGLAEATTGDEQLRIVIRHHLEALGRDRALAVVSQVELRHSLKFMSLFSHEEVGEYLNVIRRTVDAGQQQGTFRRNVHPQLVAKAVFGVLDEMVTSWILSEKDYDLAGQADQVADLMLAGLL